MRQAMDAGEHTEAIRAVGQALAGRYAEVGQAFAARIVRRDPGYRVSRRM